MIGIGIWAFIIYIFFIIGWNLLLKRSIAEAMALGLLIAAAFSGHNMIAVLKESLISAFTSNVMLAIMLFTFMSAIVTETGIIKRLVTILNSLLGRLKGGPAYISACASALFGLIAGSGTGNAAAVGSITIPWMCQSGWSKSLAATMNAGNAGLGIAMPPSTPMLLMLSFPLVAETLTTSDVYFALACGGAWTLLWRFILITYYVKKYNIPALSKDQILPVSTAFRTSGSSLTMFLGCIIPICLTVGPIHTWFATMEQFGEKAIGAINIILWVPILIALICLIEGWRYLPKSLSGFKQILLKTRKSCSTVGGMSFFSLAGSSRSGSSRIWHRFPGSFRKYGTASYRYAVCYCSCYCFNSRPFKRKCHNYCTRLYFICCPGKCWYRSGLCRCSNFNFCFYRRRITAQLCSNFYFLQYCKTR